MLHAPKCILWTAPNSFIDMRGFIIANSSHCDFDYMPINLQRYTVLTVSADAPTLYP